MGRGMGGVGCVGGRGTRRSCFTCVWSVAEWKLCVGKMWRGDERDEGNEGRAWEQRNTGRVSITQARRKKKERKKKEKGIGRKIKTTPQKNKRIDRKSVVRERVCVPV